MEVGFLLALLDVVPIAASEDLPVDQGRIVTVNVLAVFRELHAEPLEGTAMKAGEKAFDDRARLQLEGAQPREDRRVEELAIASVLGHGSRPT